jgi:hypothetical protein
MGLFSGILRKISTRRHSHAVRGSPIIYKFSFLLIDVVFAHRHLLLLDTRESVSVLKLH